jgi:hypothetical protein
MTAEARHRYKRELPKSILTPKHTQSCRVLPTRLDLLDVLPKNGVVAELGVAFGEFTDEILGRSTPRELYLIDAWGLERYEAGLQIIKEKFASQIAARQIRILRGLSTEMLANVPDATFDWIYIDTDHTYHTTLAELVLANKKVKEWGFIAGHDFCTGNVVTPVPYGVIEACHKFALEYAWKFNYLTLESDGHLSFALSRLRG